MVQECARRGAFQLQCWSSREHALPFFVSREGPGTRRACSSASMPTNWYRDLVIYEIYTRAFFDSNGDGIGDLAGLTLKMDYVRDLGVGAIWLLPIFPSPLRDDGYDVTDFRGIHPDLGTLDDFKRLLDTAHVAGLRVLIDIVLNHTSDQHPWFESARRGTGQPYHDYYVWSSTPDRYPGARVIFNDTETSNWALERASGLYYFHRFYTHQPDLNYENPEVHREMLDVVRFWLDIGVDGFRVDAAPYLYEREGTSCESLPETHAFLKALRKVVDAYSPPRLLLAEANQRPEELVPYFGDGDEFQMAFHFPLMTRLYLALGQQSAKPLVELLRAMPTTPDGCQWAMFLRNHDELTLETVTESERIYMFDAYAARKEMRCNLGIRRRLWPLMDGGRAEIELLHGLILGLPGCAVLYYGDEIGMGDDLRLGDRMGVRTPMQWTAGLNAGFSSAPLDDLVAPVITDPEYHYAGLNVASFDRRPSSFLNWLRRMLKVHRADPAFHGTKMRLLAVENPCILGFVRENEDGAVLCLYNLAPSLQPALVDLTAWQGRTPVDIMGKVALPVIGAAPYLFTLAPHSFVWVHLERR
jgi:maltose alpha-D-glucosyltransferase/alpha-amylase